jgi:hypothetical protein
MSAAEAQQSTGREIKMEIIGFVFGMLVLFLG